MGRDRIFMSIMIALLIFLSVTLCLAVAGSDRKTMNFWSYPTNGSQSWGNMFVGGDGTFYTIADHSIVAIAPGGSVRWSLPLDSNTEIRNIASGENDLVYMRVVTNGNSRSGYDLLAITPEGHIIWKQPLTAVDYTGITVAADRLYLLTLHGIEIFDSNNGSRLPGISPSFWPPAVDRQGNMYIVQDDEPEGKLTGIISIMKAYGPEGNLLWAHNLSEYGIDYDNLNYNWLRVMNNSLIVTDGHHLASIGYDGNLLRQENTSHWTILTDVDTDGNLYFAWQASNGEYLNYDIISPDDSEKTLNGLALTEEMGKYYGISDGIAYYAKVSPDAGNKTLADLDTYVLSAYDLCDEKLLWAMKIMFDPHVTTLNTSGIGLIMYNWDVFQTYVANNVTPGRDIEGLEPGLPGLTNRSMLQVTIGGNAVYVVNWAYNYVNPFIFDNSMCVYAGGICALDSNGNVLWSRETDSYVTSMTEKNGTIFYRTGDGRLSSTGVDVAAGFALAAFYLFFRFFMLGAVSRARTRLDHNENRARLMDFIAGSPGATLYEMARGLGMNVGTVRYHLLILSVNHKVRTSKDRKKYVRYFTNQGAYTEDEMVVLTLMKREHVGRLMEIMLSCPGTSNREISLATGLPDSVISRYMRELAGQGIIEKRRQENGRQSYVLLDRYKNAVLNVRSHMNNELCLPTERQGRPAVHAIASDE